MFLLIVRTTHYWTPAHLFLTFWMFSRHMTWCCDSSSVTLVKLWLYSNLTMTQLLLKSSRWHILDCLLDISHSNSNKPSVKFTIQRVIDFTESLNIHSLCALQISFTYVKSWICACSTASYPSVSTEWLFCPLCYAVWLLGQFLCSAHNFCTPCILI